MDRQRIRKKKDLRLVGQLGLMEYLRASKIRPDVRETEVAPFCAALRLPTKA